jgi:hypothetical protein
MADVFERSQFGWRMLRHTLRDRAAREHGNPSARVSPMFDVWTEGLFANIRSEAVSYVESSKLRLHPEVAAVNSSMAFGFNLFMPFRLGDRLSLAKAVGQAISRNLEIESIEFEFHGRSDILGEWSQSEEPGPDDRFTAVDVALVVRDGTQRGVVLIEVKLSEGGFTKCGGRTSPGNRDREVCGSGEAFIAEPRRCYLTRTRRAVRDRRYWEIFQAQAGSVAGMFPGIASGGECPFAYEQQQPMRNHAMALGLVQAGEFAFACYGLVHHDDNPDVPTQWASYRSLLGDDRRLFTLKAGDVLSLDDSTVAWWADWQRYMRERYALMPL